MTYKVDFTDGTKTPIDVANNAVDTSTGVGLVGKGSKNFGEVIAENFLHLLENFASGSPPPKPVEGQIWFDSVNNELKYFDNTVSNSGNWKPLASMTVQSAEPATVGEQDGHFWLDSDTGILYLFYNGSWLTVSDVSGDTRVISRTRYDTSDATHRTVEVVVGGEIVSISSSDTTSWQPQNSGTNAEYLEDGTTLLNTEFSTISAGINLNETSGYVFSGTATKAQYADLAERYHADTKYPYGTIVKIGGDKEITQTLAEYETDVFGVTSEYPAFAMNSGAGNDNTHPYVALSGRVPARVVGKVKKGERLVSSNTPGHAMAAKTGGNDLNWQTVIGRALEDKINDEPGVVEIVVGTK